LKKSPGRDTKVYIHARAELTAAAAAAAAAYV